MLLCPSRNYNDYWAFPTIITGLLGPFLIYPCLSPSCCSNKNHGFGEQRSNRPLRTEVAVVLSPFYSLAGLFYAF